MKAQRCPQEPCNLSPGRWKWKPDMDIPPNDSGGRWRSEPFRPLESLGAPLTPCTNYTAKSNLINGA
ncbi:hypothetical protein F5984_06740 [Rudanella paleaurantiibacter]|uniref:Uncharacterized protein n=1 Tax=Rudanella paleaurantiibacter TaxID=2614655 RepID=A0A7J5U299_9BACT|nr:hypothetical protein [Rudanella paleaurantiibacter]KAB7731913.1 hypothetical protein F5984_06740 [Rudanella paleaurantiibacter]